MPKTERETCHTSLNMDKNLHRQLKIFSFTEDIEMRDVIQEGVRAMIAAYTDPAIKEQIIAAGSFTEAVMSGLKKNS